MTGTVMRPHVLLIEDDLNLVELMRYNLEREGYEVAHVANGLEGLHRATANPPDLILLDWMLPDLSGLEICRRLKANRNSRSVPIIMVSAKSEEADRVRGLATGADDYVAKPFSPRELFARIAALLRRAPPSGSGPVLRYADITLDQVQMKASRAGHLVHLGPTEFRLLAHFMANPCKVFTREQLIAAIWGDEGRVELRTIDQHVRRLRKALNMNGAPDIIRTVSRAGYSLDIDARDFPD
ncbi:MAG: phosphate regulon transcriptional regulator PhoB [Rhodothalassiaceae bacterium]